MAILTAQTATSSGITPTVVTPGVGGDKVPVGSNVRVLNGTAGAITITMTTHQEYDGDLAVPDRVVNVPASEVRVIKATAEYRNPDDGLVDILSSDTTAAVDLEVTI